MDRRAELLFPTEKVNNNYYRIREKLVGITLRYEPDILGIIAEIINHVDYDSEIKNILKQEKALYSSVMEKYSHKNLRTFQFFLSKVSYLLQKLKDIPVTEEFEAIGHHIISETLDAAVKFKSNYQPPRDDSTWLRTEQETNCHSIKVYVEMGTFNFQNFSRDVFTIQNEIKANIPQTDPYYLIYREYYLHTQKWCEEQLEKMIQQLENDKYPVSFYPKIILAIQRLLKIGFDENYMNRTMTIMIDNISKKEKVEKPESILWYIEDSNIKESVSRIIDQINFAIENHTDRMQRDNIPDILQQDNWVEKLENYTNPNKNIYLADMSIFSKATTEQWINALDKASPSDIYKFRRWLDSLYPQQNERKHYSEDAETIKGIFSGLKKLKTEDLIKHACIDWVCNQLDGIVRCNEISEVSDTVIENENK